MKERIPQLISALKKEKVVALLAPSFVGDFNYPSIISELKQLGFSKVVELTFGAKLVNKEYHRILCCEKDKLWISSTCPGVVESISHSIPELKDNLMPVDSPMIATAKVCKKIYKGYKTCFISPCYFKKIEAEKSEFVDYVIDYHELHQLFVKKLIVPSNKEEHFDKFYNDYTKVYPLSGGLSKTAHLMGVLKPRQEKIIDGWKKIKKFLKKPDKNVRFLDCTFCKGGCIGGPCTNGRISLRKKKKLVLRYLERAKHEKIPSQDIGLIKKAEGLSFRIGN